MRRGGREIPASREQRQLVAIVDDNESMRRALVGLMKASGFLSRAFASGEEFLNSRYLHRTACLIADIRMPGMTGLELQDRLNAEPVPIPTIFITVDADEKTRQLALAGGTVQLLTKPFDDEVLVKCVRVGTGFW